MTATVTELATLRPAVAAPELAPAQLLNALPSAVYAIDAQGLITAYNEKAAELWGERPQPGDPAQRYCGSFRLFRPDGQPLPHELCPMADAVREGKAIKDGEVVIERRDGSRLIASVNITPLRDAAGGIVGAINSFFDITDRKRAEAALQESRDSLEDFFENSVVGMHWVGPDGIIMRANQAELDLMGYTKDEYVGRSIAEFHADRFTIQDILARLTRGEKLDKYPARLRTKNGIVKHVQISSSARFVQGRAVSTRCCTVDVTAQRQAEDALRERERFYSQILEALPVAVYTTDRRGRITYFNEAAVKFSGRRPTLGSDEWCVSWRLFRTDGLPLPHDQCPMAVALKDEREIRGAEAIAERPDGTRLRFTPYPTLLRDASGSVVGAINTLLDLSARDQSEQQARLLSSIVSSSEDAILGQDLDGIILTWNAAAEKMFGYSSAEMVGKPVTTLIPQERRDEETLILRRIRTGERVVAFETVRRRKDGSTFDVLLTVSPIKNAEGITIGASKILRDISELKHARERQKLLLREMAHRISNLFAVTNSIVAMSARHARTPSDLSRTIQTRLEALSQAQALTRSGFLDGEGGETTLAFLIATLFKPYSGSEGEGPSRLVMQGPEVRVDSYSLSGIALLLHEFSTNAAKYGALSTPTGQVWVEWQIAGETLELHWRETGGPPVRQTPEHEGFGSYLATRVVETQFGGRLARSWNPDGVEIKIVLPLARLSGGESAAQ